MDDTVTSFTICLRLLSALVLVHVVLPRLSKICTVRYRSCIRSFNDILASITSSFAALRAAPRAACRWERISSLLGGVSSRARTTTCRKVEVTKTEQNRPVVRPAHGHWIQTLECYPLLFKTWLI